MRRFLIDAIKYAILAAVFIAALAVIGIMNINDIAEVEGKKSSYTRTQFDYFISSPDKNQVDDIESDDSVGRVFPYYALSSAFTSAKDIFLLLSDDMDDYSISLFTEETCISGGFDKDGVMLDNLAAEKLGVKVGDSLSFTILGTKITRKVSGIYLTSTYGMLTKGIALADFSSDIQAVYAPSAYSAAFLTANDVQGVEALLKDYVGEGNMLSYDDYVTANCTKPPYQSDEEYEAECREKYEEYREKCLADLRKGDTQVAAKADSYALVKDQIETTESKIDTLTLWTAIACLILYVILNVIFVVAGRKNDLIRCDEGMRALRMFFGYVLYMALTSVVVAAVTFGILFIKAASTFFAAACTKLILYFTLPVIIALPLLIIFALIYVGSIYSNSARF